MKGVRVEGSVMLGTAHRAWRLWLDELMDSLVADTEGSRLTAQNANGR